MAKVAAERRSSMSRPHVQILRCCCPHSLGVALLVFLIRGTGPSRVVDQVKTVGWGLGLVIALGGIAHLTKTLAWRLTFLLRYPRCFVRTNVRPSADIRGHRKLRSSWSSTRRDRASVFVGFCAAGR